MIKENPSSSLFKALLDEQSDSQNNRADEHSLRGTRAAQAHFAGTNKSDFVAACSSSASVLRQPPACEAAGVNAGAELGADIWMMLQEGVRQRHEAISAFLTDVITCCQLPRFLNSNHAAGRLCKGLPASLLGIAPDSGTWSRLTSVDVFMDCSGQPLVMDQELSCPSGLAKLAGLQRKVVANREFTDWVRHAVSDRTDLAAEMVSFNAVKSVAILDSGASRSSYRESLFLSQALEAPLVGNRDLRIEKDGVWGYWDGQMRRIDLLIRRVDDELLDPNCFRPDSLVGVPGLVRAVRQGLVQLSSLPGTGLLRNRVISGLVPELIDYYLKERPILPTVKTLFCGDPEQRDLVLGNLDSFVVRTVDVMHPARPFIGNCSPAAQKADITARLLRDPESYVARPILCTDRSDLTNGESSDADAGFSMRLFAGGNAEVSLLSMGLGCSHQADGGAGESVMHDSQLFLVH